MLDKSLKGLGDIYGYYPKIASVVTAKSNGKSNALAVAWHSIVSMSPPAYGISISPKRFTHGMIVDSGAFGVNFLPRTEAELIGAVGGCSGRDVDKFKELRIQTVDPLVLNVPIIKASYMAIECRWVSTLKCGDHDWFVGSVEATHYQESAFDKDGMMNVDIAQPTTYLGSDSYLMIPSGEVQHLERKSCVEKRKRR